MDKPARMPPELEEVATQVGEFIEYFGFKRIHGKIWANLFLSAHPLDAGQLIERLEVSKALVSMSIADLQNFDVIRIAGKSARGTTTYEANPEIMTVIMNVIRQRERRLLSRVSAATRLLKETPKIAAQADLDPDRVQSLFEFVRSTENCLDGMLQLGTVSFEDLLRFNLDQK